MAAAVAAIAVNRAPPRRPWWLAAVAAAVALLVLLSPLNGWLSRPTLDWQLRRLAPTHIDPGVVVFDIDDASLAELKPQFGAWPFKRDVYALAIEQLRDLGARAIAIDLLLADAQPGDKALAQAVARPGAPVVLAAAGLNHVSDDGHSALPASPGPTAGDAPAYGWPTLALPTVSVWPDPQRLPLLGVITAPLDSDGVLRGLPMWHQSGSRRLPQMALALHVALDGAAAGRPLPLDRKGTLHLALPARPAGPLVRPFSELARSALSGQRDPALSAAVAGRVAFIGSSALLADGVMTTQGQMSGTAVLAQAYAALRDGQWVKPPSLALDAMLVLLALLPALWTALRGVAAPGRDAAVAVLALLAGAGVAALLLATRQPTQWAAPVLGLLTGLLLSWWLHQRKLAAAQRQLAHEVAVAAEAARSKSAFLANISHEMRTPLNALIGVADLLSDSPLTDRQQQHVQVFRDAGQALHDLINDLLDLSKIEANKLDLDLQPFSLRYSLQHLLALMRPRADGKGLRLRLDLSPDLPDGVLGDRKRVEQGLMNLLGNAIKFTHQGEVLLKAAPDPEHADGVLFEVHDSGIGIAPSKLEAIFEPFAQADGSITRQYGGTGLGLAITRSVAQLMGGSVDVRSMPGVGSVFTLRLRLPAAALPAEPPAALAQALATLPRPLNVLLAEDNEVNVYIFLAMLEGQPLAVDVAPNGPAALDLLRTKQYDLAFIDVQMPGMDGLSVTRELRRLEAGGARPRTPVVALTANAFASDVQASAEAGCDRHVAKPFSKGQLLDALQHLATRPGTTSAAPRGEQGPHPAPVPATPPGPHGAAIDVVGSIERLGGDTDLFDRLAVHAVVFMAGWGNSFEQARAEGDAERARRLTHDLVGIARTVGATALADAALAVQRTLSSDRGSDLSGDPISGHSGGHSGDPGASGCSADPAALAHLRQALPPVIAALTLRDRRS